MHYLDHQIIEFITKEHYSKKNQSSSKNLDIFFGYIPLSPEQGERKTLTKIGNDFKITSESVRQTINNYCQLLKKDEYLSEYLKKIIRELNSLCPTTIEYANSHMMKLGFLKGPNIESIITISQKLHENNSIKIVRPLGAIENKSTDDFTSLIHSYLNREVVHNGVSNLNQMMDRFGDVVYSRDSLMSIIKTAKNIKMLDNEHFYFGRIGRNRLIYKVEGILNSYKEVKTEVLESAIHRAWKFEINKEINKLKESGRYNENLREFTKVPPNEIIALISVDLGMATEKDGVLSSNIFQSKKEKTVDKQILDFIYESGGSLREKAIENYVIGKDKRKRFACMQFLNSSQLIAKGEERGVYLLLGKRV